MQAESVSAKIKLFDEVQCFKYMGLQVETELMEPEVNLRVMEECNGL